MVGTAGRWSAMSEVRADIQAERGVLGMLLSGAPIDPVAKILTGDDFYQPRHESVWRAIVRVSEAGNQVGPATVRVALDQSPENVDPTYLFDLMGDAPLGGDCSWYAQRVIDEARFRRLDAAATQIRQAAQNRALDLSEARDIARRAVDEATASGERSNHVRVTDVLPEVLDIAEGGSTPALSTPWPDVDRLITGIAPGRLVIIGARPGVGKSVCGTNLALHFAKQHGHSVLIASMEMGRTEVVQRLVAAHARVDLTRLSAGGLSEQQWATINSHFADIDAMPITIDDTASQTVTSIRSVAREMSRDRDDLALIVVDYLQLMRSPEASGRASRVEVLGEISRGLKILARETGACVVAMAQVNREGMKHSDGRPKMSDLRESGSIEADADQVILLHRPNDGLPELEVIVDKNRWGPKGMATLHMQGHYARLGNIHWTPTGATA